MDLTQYLQRLRRVTVNANRVHWQPDPVAFEREDRLLQSKLNCLVHRLRYS